MKGALKHKAKRVVFTSTALAVSGGNAKQVLTQSDWADVDNSPPAFKPYIAGKTYAEKAAWDFVKNLKQDEKLELVTVCPGLLFGPSITGHWGVVGDIAQGWAKDGLQANHPAPMVDVRDVVEAHLQAILKKDAAEQRFILVESNPKLANIYNALVDFLPHKNLPRNEDTDDSENQTFDVRATQNVLGINFTPIGTAATDMVVQMNDAG